MTATHSRYANDRGTDHRLIQRFLSALNLATGFARIFVISDPAISIHGFDTSLSVFYFQLIPSVTMLESKTLKAHFQ